MLRKLLGSIYKRINRLTAHPYQVYRRRGAYWLLNKHTSMDETFIKFKPYEEDLIDGAREVIRRHGITQLYDIGAHIGYYSVSLGMAPQIKAIRTFEPLPMLQLQVGANILINGLVDKWRGFDCALAEHPGTADIHFHPFWLGTSSLDAGWTERAKHSVQVDVRVFDELIDVQGERCFVKIDVEGSELRVLQGMTGFLARNQVFLQIEAVGEKAAAVQGLLEGLGYRLVARPSSVDYYFSNFAPDRAAG